MPLQNQLSTAFEDKTSLLNSDGLTVGVFATAFGMKTEQRSECCFYFEGNDVVKLSFSFKLSKLSRYSGAMASTAEWPVYLAAPPGQQTSLKLHSERQHNTITDSSIISLFSKHCTNYNSKMPRTKSIVSHILSPSTHLIYLFINTVASHLFWCPRFQLQFILSGAMTIA